jgi:mono/diheme cytochrome c family protein
MQHFSFKNLIIGLAAGTIVLASDPPAKTLKPVPVKVSGTIDGAELFREHCAVCHGIDGKGRGPAADALKRPLTDLTRISGANGGKFPALAVQQKINGGEVIEHGTVEMPMWGKLLMPAGRTKADAEMRVFALLKYIEQIQAR